MRNCNDDENNRYEYDNKCYPNCPPGTHKTSEESFLCEILNCEILYNYDRTECIESAPEGYFINSTEYKTIDKCHVNCKTCNGGPSENNNNCTTCPETGTKFFDLGNCTSECINGNFCR